MASDSSPMQGRMLERVHELMPALTDELAALVAVPSISEIGYPVPARDPLGTGRAALMNPRPMESAMKSVLRLFVTSATLACVIALAGCGAAPPDEPMPSADPPASQTETTQPSDSAEMPVPVDLLDELEAADYTKWTPAPGNESRVAAKGPHGDEVQILLDPTAEEGLASGGDRWPLDSIIAKDIFRNGELIQIAAMKKTADGWYWGEWDAQGKPIAEGIAAEPCEGCHAGGTDGTLGVVLK